MSIDGWNTVLVLGGIRSGKSEFAEALVADAPTVRYLATAADTSADEEWSTRLEAHRARRPTTWTTEETAGKPRRLVELLAAAQPAETLLVDDVGGWVTALLDPAHQPVDTTATIAELAAAVRSCPARVVLVSAEVGLSLVPTTPLGRAFTDALGTANRAIADAVDTVVLVVAGQPSWLKPPPPTRPAAVPAQVTPAAVGSRAATGAAPAPTPLPQVLTASALPAPAALTTGDGTPWLTPPMAATDLTIEPGLELPMPDEDAGSQAVQRVATRDLPGAGFGGLTQLVEFAAATQGTAQPTPWASTRVLLVHGDHAGGAAAGTASGDSARRAQEARDGQGAWARLAAEAGAELQVVDAPAADPIETDPALPLHQVEAALQLGWRLADQAADAGVRLLVLGACGAGTDAAAAAVLAATAGAEPPAVLARVRTDAGEYDDAAWMVRCAAVRDGLHRSRHSSREPKEILAEVGGGDIAVATGVLLGAAARRLPVLLDGPVGVAAGLVSRDLAGPARHWCLLADHGGHPGVQLAADVLGLTPLLDLRLDVGEGGNALVALPLLRSALALAAALPAHPSLRVESDEATPDEAELTTEPAAAGATTNEPDETKPATKEPEPATEQPEPATPRENEPDFREPEPAGPGPTSTDPESTPLDSSGWRAG
ncbi:bifunctional adenosylcobinamide kinase/adenosylcobinamide-phosphate guanylyltransferase [Salinispora fenicalii]|uniref:bifunctional adenosylcobinamide kinase/adenosylcobinamide-phosphate guanylyltransferase n=1 Tax=Salinispora fenicalii TaxID=1137263 RepID=UPI0004836C66|nr:bifunctional adenosylcobinamide kinase/adenosylcobinamide-phosphate guanylyltransferase [Salinispora fenicalii]